jgi:hypothetical protein
MMSRFFRLFRTYRIVIVTLAIAMAAVEARQAPAKREPASKAAAIVTWPLALREQYIAALDSFFLTRTVKAGSQPYVLDHGRSPDSPTTRWKRSTASTRTTSQ